MCLHAGLKIAIEAIALEIKPKWVTEIAHQIIRDADKGTARISMLFDGSRSQVLQLAQSFLQLRCRFVLSTMGDYFSGLLSAVGTDCERALWALNDSIGVDRTLLQCIASAEASVESVDELANFWQSLATWLLDEADAKPPRGATPTSLGKPILQIQELTLLASGQA